MSHHHWMPLNPSYTRHAANFAAVPRFDYFLPNSNPPAFFHERLDQTYTRHDYRTENEFAPRQAGYQSSIETPSMKCAVIRSPQGRNTGSRTQTSPDRVSRLSKDIYKKSLGKHNYEKYYIESWFTENVLDWCLEEMDRLVANYGKISSSTSCSENPSLLSCLESMWTRISQLETELHRRDYELHRADDEVATLKVTMEAQKTERRQLEKKRRELEKDLEAAEYAVAILQEEIEGRVKENEDLHDDIANLSAKFRRMHVSPKGLSYSRGESSDAQNQLREIYKQCRALEDENKHMKLKLETNENTPKRWNAACAEKSKSYQRLNGENKDLRAKCNRLEIENKSQMKTITNLENQVHRYEEKEKTHSARKPRSETLKSNCYKQRSSSVPRKVETKEVKRNHNLEAEAERLTQANKVVAAEASKYRQKCEALIAELKHYQAQKKSWKEQTFKLQSLMNENAHMSSRISELENEAARHNKLHTKYFEDDIGVSAYRIRLQNSEDKKASLLEIGQEDVRGDKLSKEIDKLQRRLDDLNKLNADLQEKRRVDAAQLDELKRKSSTLQNRLRDEENNNAALQERGRKDYFQLNELTKEKDKLRKEISDLEDEVAKLNQRIKREHESTNNAAAYKNRISDLEDEVAKLNQRIKREHESTNNAAAYKNRLLHAEKECVSLSEMRQKDASSFDQLKRENEKLESRLSDAENENELLKNRERTLSAELCNLAHDKDSLQSRLKHAETEKAYLKEKTRKDTDQSEYLEKETDALKARVRDADKEIVFLKDKERTDASQLNILTDDNANLQSRLNNAETEKESLQKKIQNDATKTDNLVQEYTKLQNRIKEFIRRNDGLAIANKRYSETTEEHEREKNTLLERLNIVEKEKQSLQETLKTNAAKSDHLVKDNNELRHRLENAETEKESIQKKIQNDALKPDHLVQEYTKLQNRIKEFERQNDGLAIVNKRYSETAEEHEREKNKLLERLKRTENENSSVKQKAQKDAFHLEQLQLEIQQLKTGLNDAEKENQNLSGKLNQAKASSEKLFKERDRQENSMRELEDQNRRLESIKKDQRDKIKTLEKEKDSLLTRLSQYTSAQLVQDNPNVADLSDLNRPTKLAEKFSELYDNDWTDAFEVLVDQYRFSEEQGIKRLLDILMVAYQYAIDTADQQVNMLKKALIGPTIDDRSASTSLKLDSVQLRIIQDLRKQTSQQSVESVKKGLLQHLKTKHLGDPDPSLFLSYINKCAELCWYMVLPSPPLLVAPIDSPGDAFDKNKYRFYQTSGKAYRFIVWPALYLHRGGNMLAKGIAEAM